MRRWCAIAWRKWCNAPSVRFARPVMVTFPLGLLDEPARVRNVPADVGKLRLGLLETHTFVGHDGATKGRDTWFPPLSGERHRPDTRSWSTPRPVSGDTGLAASV